jgi:peptidoglycan hydrolase CwlO-like protein
MFTLTQLVLAICLIISVCFFLYEFFSYSKYRRSPSQAMTVYQPKKGNREDVEFELQEIKSRLSEIQDNLKNQREKIKKAKAVR